VIKGMDVACVYIYCSYSKNSRSSHIGKLHVTDSIFSCSIGKLANVMVFSFSVLVNEGM
jgi:hypothetical protein